ncbi:MAG: metalloregulator ArsR/SmtB family transcription factor [Pyrinomonadaceae bacterium]
MNAENILAGTASLFMALGDKTRLRLLNLMRDREVCVSSFTGTLGYSQPLVSRHLAYLRNSGIVETRRDGKWMHYSLSKTLDEDTSRLLLELFRWMEMQEGLRVDRNTYQKSFGAPDEVGAHEKKLPAIRKQRVPKEEPAEVQGYDEIQDHYTEPIPEPRYESYVQHHNDLEDFLL